MLGIACRSRKLGGYKYSKSKQSLPSILFINAADDDVFCHLVAVASKQA